jgi:hypothetical protein
MLIQEYQVKIKHISGVKNYLADIISRNPAGLTQEQIRQIKKPRDIMVAVINLNISPQFKADLKDLERHQINDPFVEK